MQPLSPQDIGRLVAFEHRDPHSVLGAHPLEVGQQRGVVVRVFRPNAWSIRIIPDDPNIPPRDAVQVHPAGLFEAVFEGAPAIFPYRYEVTYEGNKRYLLRDAYAFLPTLGDLDIYLLAEGRHRRLYEQFGAHVRTVDGVTGTSFAVWAPNAKRVSVVGDFNGWDGRLHVMRNMNGIWELFIPEIGEGAIYKYEIVPAQGPPMLKVDPFAFRTEMRPQTGGIIYGLPDYPWTDQEWMERRSSTDVLHSPWSIYELHLGAWMRVPEERGPGATELGGGVHSGRWLTYRELAPKLVEYVKKMGFTHVEFMPVTEYPFDGSWGYQVTGYFAPTARYGSPEDLCYLIDQLHAAGIGVLLDWVPAHFPRDAHGLRRFDGTALYEHLDPRQGEHADWGTMIFNYGRNEVRNFLIASALFWLKQYHFDGLRVDAVASMLYLDYSRKHGQWIPNKYGGRENLEAIEFIKELNEVVHGEHPGAVVVAEESTAWPAVSRPLYVGGLGFTYKWNMGWMHDTLVYFSKDPVHRRYHHNNLTFGFLYAWTENFILPLSHDEVVHGKQSMLFKMPGDPWQQFANLRALYAYMWAHPGKKLLFMGGEFGQEQEFSHARSLDWHLLKKPAHAGVQLLVSDLNRIYREEGALWEVDTEWHGFQWIEAHDSDNSIVAFIRWDRAHENFVICVLSATPVVRHNYKVGVPVAGEYREILNTDAIDYGGSGVGNLGVLIAPEGASHNLFPSHVSMTLPPLAVVWLKGPRLPPAPPPGEPIDADEDSVEPEGVGESA